MSRRYPETIEFTHINRPIGVEWSARNLEVEGTVPAEINGAFFRAVADPAFPPLQDNDTTLSGDGMVSRFVFENGAVDHDIRFIRTPRYEAERKARKALFGRYRNPFTDDASVQGVDRGVRNTTAMWHAGRLYLTKEDARGYEIHPHTLETLGPITWGGKLRSETMTAHVRIDPDTGEMFSFGYEAGGLATRDVAYWIIDKDGNFVREQWFQQPYCSMMHDMVITAKWAIFPVFPTTADLERMKQGGAHWIHEADLDSWVGIMPRYGDVSEMRWFRGPKGVSAYHAANAFEEGDQVHIDLCLMDNNVFPFIREASGVHIPQYQLRGGLTRWTLDMSGAHGDSIQSRDMGPPGDLPRIRDADQGKPYSRVWLPTVNPAGGPPPVGGPVGTCMNALLAMDLQTGRIEALNLGPGEAISEPAHVPSQQPGHEGWLVFVVDRELDATRHVSELWIADAGNISAPPVAKVKLPVALRPQTHGCWVSAEQLRAARPGDR